MLRVRVSAWGLGSWVQFPAKDRYFRWRMCAGGNPLMCLSQVNVPLSPSLLFSLTINGIKYLQVRIKGRPKMTASILVWELDLRFSKCGPLGTPETLSGRPQRQNCFHSKTETSAPFHRVDSAVILQMPPPVPQPEPGWWLHTPGTVCHPPSRESPFPGKRS